MDLLCKLPNAKYGVKPYDIRRYEKDHYHDKSVLTCMLADPFKESIEPVALTCSPHRDRFQEILPLLYVQSFDDLDMEQVWDWDESRSVCIFYKRFEKKRPRLAGCAFRDDAGSNTRVRVGRCVIAECALLTSSDPDNNRADLMKTIKFTPLIQDMSEDSVTYVRDNILFVPYDKVAKTDADREAFMKAAAPVALLYDKAKPMEGKGSFVPCLQCGQDAALKCARCKRVWYCSKECQTAGWKAHKQACGKLDEA